MRKTLLTISLVLCCSFAMAQNTGNPLPQSPGNDLQVSQSPGTKPLVTTAEAGYKGSVFAKNAGDTIKMWNFDGTTANMPTVYGTSGRVSYGMYVAGEELDPNGQSNDCATWQHVGDSSWFEGTFFYNNYPTMSSNWYTVTGWMLDDLGRDGFMLMSMLDATNGTGLPHAYMSFAPVARPANVQVINISFKQEYRKFYDQCFIDYKVGNNWNTREVNVTGIDADINTWAPVNRTYTMPLELGQQNNIEIRFRYVSLDRGNAYGYFWAVDDVVLTEGETSSLQYYGEYYLEGGYGIIPQGMQLPLTWYAQVTNNGIVPQTGVNVTMQHTSPTGVVSNAISESLPNIPYDATGGIVNVVVDGRGFFNSDYPGWYWQDNPAYGTTTTVTNNGLPVSQPGVNKIQALFGTNDLSHTYPERYYTVGQADPGDGMYTWAHDNGVLASGSGGYHLGRTDDGNYITNEGHYGSEGYRLLLRYTTGNTIPTDSNGNPWVMRGMELVPDPSVEYWEYEGSIIRPVVWKCNQNDDGSVYFQMMNTGTLSYMISYEDNNYLGWGYAMPGQYNTIRISFPEQLELEPNTSYFIGYYNISGGGFSVAKTANRYYDYNGDYVYFQNDSVLQHYINYFTPNKYDIYVLDPYGSGGGLWAGTYESYTPMIHSLVGPRVEVPRDTVSVSCSNTSVFYNDTEVCGQSVSLAHGGAYQFECTPYEGYTITQLLIDGVAVEAYNEEWEYGDPNYVIESGTHRYTFNPLNGNHSITVISAWGCQPPAYPSVQVVSQNEARISGEVDYSIFEVEYGPSGFTHGNGTTISLGYTNYYDFYIDSLTPNSSYDIYIRKVCNPSDDDSAWIYSDWSDVVTFSTTMTTIINHGNGYIWVDDYGMVMDTTYVNIGRGINIATLNPDYFSGYVNDDAYRVLSIWVDGVEYDLNNQSLYASYESYDYYTLWYLYFGDGLPHTVEVYFGSYYGTVSVVNNNTSLGYVTGEGSYSPGSTVTLTAISYAGATFTGWNGGASTSNPLYFTMGENDTTITVGFAPATAGEIVYDTIIVQIPVHDTTVVHEYIYDTTYVPVHDTTVVQEYIYDTTYVPVHDTTIVTFYDTMVVQEYVYDTTYVPVHDTTVIYADTAYLEVEVHDTIYLYDTIVVHDTIIIYDTTGEGIDYAISNIKLYGDNGQIVVEGSEGATVRLYDAVGRMIAMRRDEFGRLTFDVPASGVYLVKVGEHPARRIAVIR